MQRSRKRETKMRGREKDGEKERGKRGTQRERIP